MPADSNEPLLNHLPDFIDTQEVPEVVEISHEVVVQSLQQQGDNNAGT